MSLCCKQLIERHVLGRGLGKTVIGEYATAEAPQSVHDGCTDASCSDDADGHIAEFSATHVVQSVVMGLNTADGGLGMSHRHEHQHQRVISDAVGRIGDILDGDAHALRVLDVDVVVPNASRRDVPHAGLAKREKDGTRDSVLMSDADASIPRCQVKIGA